MFCAFLIFSGGREPEEEGSCVVVAVGKIETVIYLKGWHGRWRKLVNVVTPYKNYIIYLIVLNKIV